MCVVFVFFKQKTAYEMRISDWSSDVCSSDLIEHQRSLVTRPCAGYNLGVQTRLRANNMSQNHRGNQAGFTVLASNRKNAPTRDLRVLVDFPNESLLKILKHERLSLGRAPGGERVCRYVWIWGVGVERKEQKEKE